MLSALAWSSRSIDCRNWKSPMFSSSERLCVHTKKIVEPGRYSHRSTALPRSDTKLKLGSLKARESALFPVIGCTTYVPSDARAIVPPSRPYTEKANERARAPSLKSPYRPAEISGGAYTWSARVRLEVRV